MRKRPFLPEDFVATRFSTAADKADFGNTLLHFIESDCKREFFTKDVYQRLCNCFGNIAHGDRAGFYEEWFRTETERLHFIRHTLAGHCWGDPQFTFSDVERAIQHEIKRRGYLARYELQATVAEYSRELEILQRLEAKHRSAAIPRPAYEEQLTAPASEKSGGGMGMIRPVQTSLFGMS